ncbi:MAG: hypothetical protein R2848_06545 [Thermomicrobiales bacterium]
MPKHSSTLIALLVLTVVIRALYIVPLIYLFRANSDRASRLPAPFQRRVVRPISDHEIDLKFWGRGKPPDEETIAAFERRGAEAADIDYYRHEQMGVASRHRHRLGRYAKGSYAGRSANPPHASRRAAPCWSSSHSWSLPRHC